MSYGLPVLYNGGIGDIDNTYGTATLGSGGSIDIPCSHVQNDSCILFTYLTNGGNFGQLSATITPGSNIHVFSNNSADRNTFSYLVVKSSDSTWPSPAKQIALPYMNHTSGAYKTIGSTELDASAGGAFKVINSNACIPSSIIIISRYGQIGSPNMGNLWVTRQTGNFTITSTNPNDSNSFISWWILNPATDPFIVGAIGGIPAPLLTESLSWGRGTITDGEGTVFTSFIVDIKMYAFLSYVNINGDGELYVYDAGTGSDFKVRSSNQVVGNDRQFSWLLVRHTP